MSKSPLSDDRKGYRKAYSAIEKRTNGDFRCLQEGRKKDLQPTDYQHFQQPLLRIVNIYLNKAAVLLTDFHRLAMPCFWLLGKWAVPLHRLLPERTIREQLTTVTTTL